MDTRSIEKENVSTNMNCSHGKTPLLINLFIYFYFSSAKSTDKHADNSPKLVAIDNVYSGNHFQTRLFSIADAIEAHREVNSPTMLDSPNASIIANIELNMDGEKPTKPVNNFTANIMIEHSFDHGEIRSVIAFVKDQVHYSYYPGKYIQPINSMDYLI